MSIDTEKAVMNREYKDRVFKIIFGNPKHKDLTLSLYNAVNGSNYTNPDDITINTMEDAIFMNLKNDVSFIIANMMNIYEHQSSINPNIPVRALCYAGALYSKYISDKRNGFNQYSSKLQKIPVPKIVCFYNGEKDMPDKVVLSLRDAFDEGADPDIEVRVTMLNVNYGHNEKLLKDCRALNDYGIIISKIREKQKGKEDVIKATSEVINNLPDDSPIKQILKDNESEVLMSFLTEYDEEWTMQMFKEEGREEGREEGKSRATKHAAKVIAEKFNMSFDEAYAMLTE